MTTGACLCGSIRFEMDEPGIALSVGCYCTNCRKISGGQYGVYLQVRRGAFRWVSGEDQVESYESSPGNRRGFCRRCGCVAPIETQYGAMRVPGGLLDDDPGVAPQAALFTASKAPWCDLKGTTNAFADAGPPDFWRRVIVGLHTGG